MNLKRATIVLIILGSIIYTFSTNNAYPLILSIFIFPFLFLDKNSSKKYLVETISYCSIIFLFLYFFKEKSLKRAFLISLAGVSILLGLYYTFFKGTGRFWESLKDLFPKVFEKKNEITKKILNSKKTTSCITYGFYGLLILLGLAIAGALTYLVIVGK